MGNTFGKVHADASERRAFLQASVAVAAVAALGGSHGSLARAAALTKAQRDQMTAEQIITMMQQGNERFRTGKETPHNYLAQQKASAKGQYPAAVILSCIDSRAPAETVLDLGIGDVFNARVAGNIANDDILGSLEFATKLMGARLVVVLGHSDCGAIKGATDGAKLGHLTAMLGRFAPAIKASSGVAGEHSSKNTAYVQVVAETNVKQAAKQLTARSDVLRGLVETRGLRVVAAMHDVATGRVTFFA